MPNQANQMKRTLNPTLYCPTCEDKTAHLFREMKRGTERGDKGTTEHFDLCMYECLACANLRVWGKETAYGRKKKYNHGNKT